MTYDIPVFSNKDINLCVRDSHITGIQKLAQKVMLELLTDVGSFAYLSDIGCYFLTNLKICKTEFDIIGAFGPARATVIKNITAKYTRATPSSERIEDIHIANISLGNDEVILQLVITNKAGNGITISTPPLSTGA